MNGTVNAKNVYGLLRETFGSGAKWADIKTPTTLVITQRDLDNAIEAAPELATDGLTCQVCLLAQATHRVFDTRAVMNGRVLYWGDVANPKLVHRGVVENAAAFTKLFDLAMQTGGYKQLRAFLPTTVRILVPEGGDAIVKRREYARAHRERAPEDRRSYSRVKPSPTGEPRLLSRDGFALVAPDSWS